MPIDPLTIPPKRPRLEVLDGVRFLAALYVVLFHFAAGDRSTWVTPSHVLFRPIFHALSYGWLGVELFFMISGFVICMSTWGKSIRQFAISRFVRLYPAYWIAIVLTVIVVAIDHSRARPLHAWQMLVNVTMTEGWANVPYVDPSYWTLTVELTFYLLFAATLVWRGLTYARVVTFCAVWLAASALTIVVHPHLVVLILQPVYAPYFVAGTLLYLVYRFGPNLLLWFLLAGAYASSLYRLTLRVSGQHPSSAILSYPVAAGIVTGFYVLMTLIALDKLSWIRGRWLVTAGALTYPAYLLHQQIGETVIASARTEVPHWPLLIAMLAGILALSWLVHRYGEQPLAAMFKRLLTPARPAAVIPAPAAPTSAPAPSTTSDMDATRR